MSSYNVIDAVEGRGYVDVKNFPSPSSPSSTSPRLDDYSTGRGDPLFPDIGMHLGMIFGMNSANGPKSSIENSQFDERLHMRLKFLEDSNTVMQTRNQNLITENRALSNQLAEELKVVDDLKSRLQRMQIELENEKSKAKESILKKKPETLMKEKSSQCWALCLACQRKLEGNEAVEPTVAITKSELENLESDMQALRDAVVIREEAWDKAMEREESYRQQLARLSAEIITARHLSDSRHSELQTLTITLAEKEDELKATQKDLLSLKKIIVKIERRQRDFEENFDLSNAEVNLTLMNEKEQKTVEEIVRRQVPVKQKQRPRPKGSSSMPQSLQASPRSARGREAAAAGSSSF